AAGVETGTDEVLDHLVLGVDRDRPTAGQPVEIDAVAAAAEAQLDAVVDGPLPVQPLADANLGQQIDRPLLQHAGPDRRLDLTACPPFEDDGFDFLQVEQVGEQQPRRAGAHDAHLGARARGGHVSGPWVAASIAANSSFARWNAALAAGRPQ